MKNISRFDLGIIIAFVVVTLLGGGACWYLSGQLTAAQQATAGAKSDFDHYSTEDEIIVNPPNKALLAANIEVLKAQINPLIQSKLAPKENKLSSIDKQDPVAWKHDLDDEVTRLTTAAKVRGVKLPDKFYFSFSRYLNQNPNDEQTTVLSKQLLTVEQLTNILIDSHVNSIGGIQRTYEEDPPTRGPGGGASSSGQNADKDRLAGSSVEAAGGAYVAYPFQVEFEVSPESLRKVLDGLVQSPYIFVVRTLVVQSSKSVSPQLSTLDSLAGGPGPSIIGSSPGDVAAANSTRGPQYLFGSATLHVQARIDMIEWRVGVPEAAPAPVRSNPSGRNNPPNRTPASSATPPPSSPGGNR